MRLELEQERSRALTLQEEREKTVRVCFYVGVFV
jgi:hypothetical protein